MFRRSGPSGFHTDRRTSLRLGRQPQSNTRPEWHVRTLVHSLGHRYRLRNRDLPGSPDLANRGRRWAIFVHGCFWHSHPGCPRATLPKNNRALWEEKFASNRRRDERACGDLVRAGYRVIVIWECELKKPQEVLRRLVADLPGL